MPDLDALLAGQVAIGTARAMVLYSDFLFNNFQEFPAWMI